jgi:tetratricopeptide (TPR) repeat protein
MAMLDPQSLGAVLTVVEAHRLRRDYRAARRYLDRALALGANEPIVQLEGPLLELSLRGDTAAGFRLLRNAVARMGYGKLAATPPGSVLLRLPEAAFRDSARAVTLESFGADTLQYHFRQLEAAEARGDAAAVLAHADSAAAALEPEAMSLPTMGIHVRSVAALLAAYRGRRAEALGHLAVLERDDPLAEDAFGGTLPAANVARAYAVLGERESATRHLERLLSVPSEITGPVLRDQPPWQRLRGYPPFERLLAR